MPLSSFDMMAPRDMLSRHRIYRHAKCHDKKNATMPHDNSSANTTLYRHAVLYSPYYSLDTVLARAFVSRHTGDDIDTLMPRRMLTPPNLPRRSAYSNAVLSYREYRFRLAQWVGFTALLRGYRLLKMPKKTPPSTCRRQS